MCAIARTSCLTHTNISCEQITPSHKCDKNQLCNIVANTLQHTLSIIIISLFVFTRLNTKNHRKNKQK
jgi:hypothetical protein